MKVLGLLLLLPTAALAKTENWPQLYNDGVLAYKSNDFARAAAAFESAMSTRDRVLQQRSLYNLGNASYRLGQGAPAQAQQLWERALKGYATALALDPKDADARFNHDFVKKKLEELKKQQQEQRQQNQKDQQDESQERKKDEQKQQQQEQDQQQQRSKDKQSEQQNQQQPQQSQEQQKKDQEQQDEQQKPQAQQENQSHPEQQSPEKGGQPADYGKMQAAALLDSLRENERNWNFFPEVQMKNLKDSGEPAKDW